MRMHLFQSINLLIQKKVSVDCIELWRAKNAACLNKKKILAIGGG